MSSNYRTRLKGEERSEMAGRMAELYVAGSSVRAVAEYFDRSYGATWEMLQEMGVKMRPRTRRKAPKTTAAEGGGA